MVFSGEVPWNPPLCTNGSAGYLMQLSVNVLYHSALKTKMHGSVREWRTLLPGNNKEEWGNHHIDVNWLEDEEEKNMLLLSKKTLYPLLEIILFLHCCGALDPYPTIFFCNKSYKGRLFQPPWIFYYKGLYLVPLYRSWSPLLILTYIHINWL